MNPAPILPPAGPFFRNIHHRQIQHFEETVVRRKDRFCFRHLAELAVEALDGVGRVDKPTHLFRVLEVDAYVPDVVSLHSFIPGSTPHHFQHHSSTQTEAFWEQQAFCHILVVALPHIFVNRNCGTQISY